MLMSTAKLAIRNGRFPAGAIAIGVALGTSTPAFAQAVDPVEGYWRTADGATVIEVARCGQTVCGRLRWVREGQDARDERNPSAALRSRPICGLNVFAGFRLAGSGRWSGGSIYDPEAGESIAGVTLNAQGDALSLSVGRGLFAGQETWRRVPAPAKPCLSR